MPQASLFTDKQLMVGVAVAGAALWYLSYKAKGVVNAVVESDLNLANPDNIYVNQFANWWVGSTREPAALSDEITARLANGEY